MMMKRILISTAFMVAVGAFTPVLSKEMGAVYSDLHLFRVRLRQNITIPVGARTVPAGNKADLPRGEQRRFSVCGAEISFRKVATFVKNDDGPGPKVLIELVKVDVYNPELISGVKHISKTGTGLSWGQDHILTSKSIDTLLARLNKNAFINLGQVAPGFFDNLAALNENNKVEAGRIPQLSTTNGQAAKLILGSKIFYRKKKQGGSTTTTSKSASPKAYEIINNKLSVEFKPVTSNNDELNLGISVKVSDSIENTAGAPEKPVVNKSETNLPVHSGDIIVLGGIGQEEVRETPNQDPAYKWVFMGLPKSKSGIISILFIKPTVIR